MFDLGKALQAAMPLRETREDIVEYFQEKYPGSKTNKRGGVIHEWTKKLSEALQPFAKGAKGQEMEVKNIQRRFQKRGGVDPLSKSPSRKQEAEYKALGETLPRIMPRGVEISGTICVHYADGPCEEREIDPPIVITGEEFKHLVEEADLQMIVNLYMEDPIDGPEVGGPVLDACAGDEDCQPDLNINPIE